MSPLVNNVPPRACASKVVCGQGDLAFVFAMFRVLQLAAETHMDLTTAARPTIRGEIQPQGYALSLAWPDSTARLATLSSYPGLLVLCLSLTEAYLSGFFPCFSTASDQWWGRNVQGKNLRDKSFHSAMHKSSVPRTPYA